MLAGVIPLDAATFNLLDRGNERLVKRLIKQAFVHDVKVLRDASPFYHITDKATYPRFLILNTTNRALAVEGAKKFVNKLRASGTNVQFVPVDDHTHREMAIGMYDASDPVGSAILMFILHYEPND